jgi:arylsulfatase A-like enzyme
MTTTDQVSRPPNIVLINCDDVGYGDLGCYGSTKNKTPAIDQMAADGLKFTSFYQASPWCSPSRAALLTGCYPPRIGFTEFDGMPVLFPGDRWGLDPSEVTLARVLSTHGYATQAIGKWHSGDQPDFLPTNHGFDHFFGLPYSNDMGRQVGGIPHEDRHRIKTPPLPLLIDQEVLEQQPDQASLTARYVNEAIRFMRSSRHRPFFLYLAHIYVHLPIYVQERFRSLSENGVYGAAVETIDWTVSVIQSEIVRLGLDKETIIIFTSDNGSLAANGGSNAPLRGTKGTTWEGGMRVPCLLRWPGKVAPGRVEESVVSAIDLLPSICSFAGVTKLGGPQIDGLDISRLVLGGRMPVDERPFFYFNKNDLEAIRVGNWKLHFSKMGKAQPLLFDLVQDPSESTDLLGQMPNVVEKLAAMAAKARTQFGDRRMDMIGSEVRPIGSVASPRMLTEFDPNHPYYVSEYDLADRG